MFSYLTCPDATRVHLCAPQRLTQNCLGLADFYFFPPVVCLVGVCRGECLLLVSGLVLQLAEVARTPWLDPYVAGGILAAKALSEGDWRIGKGALAAFADRVLSSLSDTGAKVLRVGSGNEVR